MIKKTIILIIFFFICINVPAVQALDLTYLEDYNQLELGNKTISMDFSNAELNKVLKIFSQQSNLNFIAATDVSNKKINLYLDKVPVEEALERILSANNLTYELKPSSNIFVVKEMPAQESNLLTRVYRLKNISVSSSNINSTFIAGGDSTGSNLISGLMDSLRVIMTGKGTVTEDPRTNSLVITDAPNRFPLIEQTIARLDVKVCQILIETEMLDISKNATEDLGVKWAQSPISYKGPEKEYLFPFNQDNAIDDKAFDFANEYTAGVLSMQGLSFIIDYLKTRADTKSLARPRIYTLNNQKANIQIKTDEAIGLERSESSDTGVTYTFERAETGIFLTVTPQANIETGEIIMAVQPRVNQARPGGTFGSGGFTSTAKDPEEISTMTVLRVMNGDTVVIGGLLKYEDSNTKTFLPFIGNLPIIGTPFRHKTAEDRQREIIVFLTPHILNEDNADDRFALSKQQPIIREQNIPNRKMDEINKELSFYER